MEDSPISFPGLFGDWEFTAGSVAFWIGQKPIYWYGIILGLGVLGGLWLCTRQAKHYGLTEDNVLDMVLWGVPLGILGARTYYVIFYLDRFRDESGALDWSRVVAIWDGGGAIYGTILACAVLAIVYCLVKRIRLGALTDLCVMGLLVGQAVGRWGNFMNREAFGAATTLPWRMRLWVSSYRYIEVHPTFLYECLWNVLGLLLILFIVSKGRRFDGENTWFYFLWYGLGRFWIEGLRTDSLYLFDWTFLGERVRVSQALSLLLVAVAALKLFVNIHVLKISPDTMLVNCVARKAVEAAQADAAEMVESPDAAATEAAQAAEGPVFQENQQETVTGPTTPPAAEGHATASGETEAEDGGDH